MNSELLASASFGIMNSKIENFLSGNSQYREKSLWINEIKEQYMEDNLEKELEQFRSQIDNEQRYFEDNLKFNEKIEGHDFLEEITCLESIGNLINDSTSDSIFKIKPIKQNKNVNSFNISRKCDIIKSIYLEVKIGENFDNLTLEDKFALLHSNITIYISGQEFLSKNILSCIFSELCCENHIIEFEDTIQIPIFNFENFAKKSDSKIKGLPLWLMTYSGIEILLNTNNQLHNLSFEIIVNGKLCNSQLRKNMRKQNNSFFMLQNQELIVTKEISNISLGFNHLCKCLLLYFKPKNNTDFWDFTMDYPSIEHVKLSLNNLSPIEYDSEEILEFEFFGIKIYLIPFSKDFATWENINSAMKNSLDNMSSSGINFNRIETALLNLDCSDSSKNFDLVINCLSFNIFMVKDGLSGFAFSL